MMKTLAYKTAIIAISILLSVASMAQQSPRNVIWVHGLDGSENSWKYYEQLFTAERNINSLRKWYNTEFSISHSTDHLNQVMHQHLGSTGATDSRNIAIGHSMGGVVARNMDRQYNRPKRFGGIITVACSNLGAPSANSMLNGDVTQYADNALVKLLSGPTINSFGLTWIIGGITIHGLNMTPLKIVNWISGKDELQNFLGNPTVNNDLKEGSPTINAINSYNTTTPRISMWAQEDSPVHWRVIGSFLGEHKGVSFNDQPFVDKINAARTVYNGFYATNLALGSAATIAAIVNPLMLIEASYHFLCANEWKKGRDWFDTSESGWKTLIKASKRELKPIVVCGFSCIPSTSIAERNIPNPCASFEWACETQMTYVTVHYPSDGFNPKYTQIIPGLPEGNVYEIKNANHIEVRNMSHKGYNGDNTRKEINNIFSFRQPPTDFFLTPKR